MIPVGQASTPARDVYVPLVAGQETRRRMCLRVTLWQHRLVVGIRGIWLE
jgi:hypothetical protein